VVAQTPKIPLPVPETLERILPLWRNLVALRRKLPSAWRLDSACRSVRKTTRVPRGRITDSSLSLKGRRGMVTYRAVSCHAARQPTMTLS